MSLLKTIELDASKARATWEEVMAIVEIVTRGTEAVDLACEAVSKIHKTDMTALKKVLAKILEMQQGDPDNRDAWVVAEYLMTLGLDVKAIVK